MRTLKYNLVIITLISLFVFNHLAAAGLQWFDGSIDESNEPPGKLLSDNEDYYGECVLTGVEYTYEIAPDKPAENRPSRTGVPGRILLNGRRGKGVGLSKGKQLVVTFDFKRQCVFQEVDVVTPSKQVSLRLEISADNGGNWQTLVDRPLDECPDQELHRLHLPSSPEGRFLRLTMQASGVTLLDEVMAWGDAVNLSETPEDFEPVAKGEYPIGVVYPTITGIGKSAVSDREAFYWVESLTAEQQAQPAVWFPVDTWGSISHQPLMPTADEINQTIKISMARNETENMALALKNTLVSKPVDVEVTMPAITTDQGLAVTNQMLTASIGVMGVIGDRGFGNNLGPIFFQDNMLGNSLMEKYILNGRQIRNFPRLTLHPSAAAVMWLTFTTENAQPGKYVATIAVEGGKPQRIEIDVLDVTLPETFAFVKTYSSNMTSMFPFVNTERARMDLAYALDCGISDFGRMNSQHHDLLLQLAKERNMKVMFSAGHVIPRIYVHNIYCGIWTKPEDFPEDAAASIAAVVQQCVATMQERGLDYDDWYGTTGDEPGHKNMAAVAYVCKLIHQADPKVNVYVNPCYWAGYDKGAVAEDQLVAEDLKEWYGKEVNISMPLFLLLRNRPQTLPSFTSPRFVNAYYYVSGQLDRAEHANEVQKYRKMAWDSLSLGLNGWGFYSYYSPRGSAWNHFDRNPKGEGLQEPSDYSIVYPGLNRVVPTRQSEALRQGKEDWNLLNLLRQQGKQKLVDELIAEYLAGQNTAQLRLKALQSAVP